MSEFEKKNTETGDKAEVQKWWTGATLAAGFLIGSAFGLNKWQESQQNERTDRDWGTLSDPRYGVTGIIDDQFVPYRNIVTNMSSDLTSKIQIATDKYTALKSGAINLEDNTFQNSRATEHDDRNVNLPEQDRKLREASLDILANAKPTVMTPELLTERGREIFKAVTGQELPEEVVFEISLKKDSDSSSQEGIFSIFGLKEYIQDTLSDSGVENSNSDKKEYENYCYQIIPYSFSDNPAYHDNRKVIVSVTSNESPLEPLTFKLGLLLYLMDDWYQRDEKVSEFGKYEIRSREVACATIFQEMSYQHLTEEERIGVNPPHQNYMQLLSGFYSGAATDSNFLAYGIVLYDAALTIFDDPVEAFEHLRSPNPLDPAILSYIEQVQKDFDQHIVLWERLAQLNSDIELMTGR